MLICGISSSGVQSADDLRANLAATQSTRLSPEIDMQPQMKGDAF
jgi:hypothetical protein